MSDASWVIIPCEKAPPDDPMLPTPPMSAWKESPVSVREIAVRCGHAALRAGLRWPHFPLLDRFREQQRLRETLGRLKTTCVLDVGANRGQFGTTLRRIGYTGRIISFEPIREDCERVRQLANEDGGWEVHQVAIGSEDGERAFNVVTVGGGQTIFSSFLTPNQAAFDLTRGQMASRTCLVPVRRLDGLIDSLCPDVTHERIFLKSDTQGNDLEVLRGAGTSLGRVAGVLTEVGVVLLYEGSPHYTEVLSFLASQGFALMDLSVVNRTEHGSVLEYDALLARPEMLHP